jgi:hypothetical protein
MQYNFIQCICIQSNRKKYARKQLFNGAVTRTVAYSGPGLRAAPTIMSWDGIYTCQFHAILVIVYFLTKTYNAVIQLLSTCLGTAKVFI